MDREPAEEDVPDNRFLVDSHQRDDDRTIGAQTVDECRFISSTECGAIHEPDGIEVTLLFASNQHRYLQPSKLGITIDDASLVMEMTGPAPRLTVLTLLLAIALASAVAPGQAQGPAQPPAIDKLAESFLDQLQAALARRDRPAVAAMVQYPITAFVNGVRVPIGDPDALIKLYDAIFTSDLVDAIAATRVPRAGRPAPVHVLTQSSDGISIAAGLVSAQQAEKGFKIVRITVPPPSPARPTPVLREPTRVVFRGRTTAKFSGLLTRPNEVQSYLVDARRGQQLQVGIDGFRGREIVLRVLDGKSGAAVASRTREGARTWTGTVPADGQYRIDVVRTAPDGGPELLYALAVTLR
jgi:hypothetical protein